MVQGNNDCILDEKKERRKSQPAESRVFRQTPSRINSTSDNKDQDTELFFARYKCHTERKTLCTNLNLKEKKGESCYHLYLRSFNGGIVPRSEGKERVTVKAGMAVHLLGASLRGMFNWGRWVQTKARERG